MIYGGEKPGRVCVCAVKRGSGISEQSEIVLIKKCEVKSSGYRQQENIKRVKKQDEKWKKKKHVGQHLLYLAPTYIKYFSPLTYSFLLFSV